MLTVYTYLQKKPANCLDLSTVPLDQLVESSLAIVRHQKNVHIWFGYLDGWMLSPQEETQLRKILRAFPCSVVSCFPISFSHAWKNEIETIYTAQVNGDSHPHHNGCAVHDGSSFGHKQVSE